MAGSGYDLDDDIYRCPAGNLLTYRHTRGDRALQVRRYRTNDCRHCHLRRDCTTGTERRIIRWDHQPLIDGMHTRLGRDPDPMTLRRCTVELPFATIRAWMGATHFLTCSLQGVRTEIAPNVLACNIKRRISLIGIRGLPAAMPG